MQCPKCNHVQQNSVECQACGLIFAKFHKVQERRKEAEEKMAEKPVAARSQGMKALQLLLLMALVAGVTYYFTAGRNQAPPSAPSAPAEAVKAPAAVQNPGPQTAKLREPQQAAPSAGSAEARPRGNAIERAKNATVSVEAPWGTGAGFFVNKNYIVTNRHVVTFDAKKLAELREQVETGRKLIDLEKQKIEQMRADHRRLPQGPSKSQLAILIDKYEENLKKILPKQEQIEQRLGKLDRKMQPSDIKIVFADGSQDVANYLLVSDKYDLALMTLFSGDHPYIDKGQGPGMRPGDKVYVIGSPVGLRHTVTSGVFSGAQLRDGQVYLQTDAAINPGNSGGPLIDENGSIRGVTTMHIQNAEGLGFAIPIEKVFEEFSSTLF
jgi:S1-C subfamily serine protease